MNRSEFETLRNLPGKRITQDILFETKMATSPNLTFEGVVVENELGYEVVLNGTYKPGIPSVTFNFVLRGTGPICRVDVNGAIHGGAGRTHKHDLRAESDPRNNLPEAHPRPDFQGQTVKAIWDLILTQANIHHTGTLTAPDQEPLP